jgi:hypothetical protein
MKTLLALVLVTALFPLSGCPGCGAFNGSSDRVLSRGQDSITLCENDGFVAHLASGETIEGMYVQDHVDTITATRGDDHQLAFTLTFANQGGTTTATTTNLGDGTWQLMNLNETELDHADIQCTDLVNRAWWGMP